jgi:2-iminobutanoate/2-iminopropanoate deaminase
MTNLKAPTPVGPYSMFRYLGDNSDSALKKGPKQYWVMAGSIPIDPESGELNNDTIEDEVNQVFNNIEAVKKIKIFANPALDKNTTKLN